MRSTRRTLVLTCAASAALSPGGCVGDGLPGCPATSLLAGDLCRPICTVDDDCLPEERCDIAGGGACIQKSASPEIRRFEVTPAIINSNDVVSFRYEVLHASQVEIDHGILARTGNLSGVVNKPVQQTTTFTLTAYGQGNATAKQTVATRGGGVAITSFTAKPNIVMRGADVKLEWTVVNERPGTIRITEPAARRIVADGLASSGSSTDRQPELPVEYWIEATGEGDVVARESIRVLEQASGAPRIQSMELFPGSPIVSGDTVRIDWRTVNASHLALRDSGPPVFDTMDPFDVALGFKLLAPPPGRRSYVIDVDGAGGARDSMPRDLDVTPREVPSLEATAEPSARDSTASPPNVVVTWQATNASIVYVVGDDMSAMGPFGPVDRVVVPSRPKTMHFRVLAFNVAGGIAERRAVSYSVVPEVEPNDFPGLAGPDQEIATVGRSGSLNDVADVDLYLLPVNDGGFVHADIQEDLRAGCSNQQSGLMIQLVQGVQRTPVAFSRIENGCPVLDASKLPQGTYYLEVRSGNGALGPVSYTLLADTDGPVCGDGIISAGEGCDDGNRIGGDGCDGQCSTEDQAGYDVTAQPGGPPEPPVEPVTPVIFRAPPGMGPRDEGSAIAPLPFPFRFFGQSYAGVVISTNGYLSFRPEAELAGVGSARLSDSQNPNAVVAPFWGDLKLPEFPGAHGEVVYWTRDGDAASGAKRWEIEFRNLTGRDHTPGSNVLLSARVTLEEETNVITIRYTRVSVTGGGQDGFTLVAGIEDAAGRSAAFVPGCNPTCRVSRNNPEGLEVTFRPKGF